MMGNYTDKSKKEGVTWANPGTDNEDESIVVGPWIFFGGAMLFGMLIGFMLGYLAKG